MRGTTWSSDRGTKSSYPRFTSPWMMRTFRLFFLVIQKLLIQVDIWGVDIFQVETVQIQIIQTLQEENGVDGKHNVFNWRKRLRIDTFIYYIFIEVHVYLFICLNISCWLLSSLRADLLLHLVALCRSCWIALLYRVRKARLIWWQSMEVNLSVRSII